MFSCSPFSDYRGNAHKHFTATGVLASITQPYVEGLQSEETSSNLYCCSIVASITNLGHALQTGNLLLTAGRRQRPRWHASLCSAADGRAGRKVMCNCRRLEMPVKYFVCVSSVHLLLVQILEIQHWKSFLLTLSTRPSHTFQLPSTMQDLKAAVFCMFLWCCLAALTIVTFLRILKHFKKREDCSGFICMFLLSHVAVSLHVFIGHQGNSFRSSEIACIIPLI